MLFKKDEEGVSNVVTTILLFSVFMIIFSTITSVYIPQWAGGREYQHSVRITGDLIELKTTVDMQIFRGDTGVELSTPISVGSPGLPFNGMGTVVGALTINAEGSHYSINVTNTTNGMELASAFGNVEYTSAYSTQPSQSYSYEGGALIMDQGQNHVVVSGSGMDLSLQRTYLLNDTTSSQGPITDYGGHGLYDAGDTVASDDEIKGFYFDGVQGRVEVTFEAYGIDNGTTLESRISNSKGNVSLGFVSANTVVDRWEEKTINVSNELLVDEGVNTNQLLFETAWPGEPWRVRNVSVMGYGLTLRSTMITMLGSTSTITSSEDKMIHSTLIGVQEIIYDDMTRNITFTVNSTYANAWVDIYDETLSDLGFERNVDYAVSVVDAGTQGGVDWGVVELDLYLLDNIYLRNAIVRLKMA